MADMRIHLADFEGPLDLLLHLIEKNKIDIYDIPIVSVTEQYIAYLDGLENYDLESASHFLLLAAMLLQIKSRMLLPKNPETEDEDGEGDPRQLLVDMLVEYRKNKKRAEALRELLNANSRMLCREPMALPAVQQPLKRYSLADLLGALVSLLPAKKEEEPVIPRQEFPIQDKMEEILTVVHKRKHRVGLLQFLHHRKNRSEAIAAFLAVLELLRRGEISISQKAPFAPLYIGEKKEEDHGTVETG